MNKSELNQTLEFTKEIAKAAGQILLKHFRSGLNIETKSNSFDLVTIADKESEAFLKGKITEAYSDHKILAEESYEGEAIDPEAYTWIIDPLDGTTNFSHGIAHYCISIALYQGETGLIGVIYNPNTDELFACSKDQPSQLNNQDIKVSETKEFQNAILATGFPYNRECPEHALTFSLMHDYHKVARGIRRFGSAALDLAHLACGHLDGFFEYMLGPWDIAAGTLIIKQAGGRIIKKTDKYIQADNGYLEWPR